MDYKGYVAHVEQVLGQLNEGAITYEEFFFRVVASAGEVEPQPNGKCQRPGCPNLTTDLVCLPCLMNDEALDQQAEGADLLGNY